MGMGLAVAVAESNGLPTTGRGRRVSDGAHRIVAGDWSPPRTSNDTISREWLTWLRDVRRRDPQTVYTYAGKLRSWLDWLDGTPLADATLQDMEAWLGRPRPRRGGGRRGQPSTVQKEVAILRGIYGFAVARGHVHQDVTALLNSPAVRNQNPNPVPDETWMRLWSCDALGAEARVVLGLGYVCGLRRAEIVALTVQHMDVKTGRIVKFRRKGGGDDVIDYAELADLVAQGLPELLPSADTFTNAVQGLVESARGRRSTLLDWAAQPNGRRVHPLAEGRIDPVAVYRRLAKWQSKAGLTEGCFTPHQLRHSFVTNLLRVGVPIHLVSRLANHANLSTTMRYAKVAGSDLREWRRRETALRGRDFGRFGA